MKADESVIDFPKEQLCPDIWTQIVGSNGGENVWALTDEAHDKLSSVVAYLYDFLKKEMGYSYRIGAHITGSITSNCYTENADVDLHLYCPDDGAKIDSDKLTDAIRAEFKENYQDLHTGKDMIGTHPIEVYFQGNVFQDMMSVGCYDLVNETWIVGPDFTSPEFNPYSEYYADIKKTASSLTKQMRNAILAAYESAIVFKKVFDNTENQDPQEYATLRDELSSNLKKAVALFVKARKSRKTLSDPTSKEEALKFRKSHEWHVSDAAFKLLDKFGYLGILKGFTECYSLLGQEEQEVDDAVAEKVIALVKDKIGNSKTLADDEQLDEGAKEMLSIAMLTGLIAIKGILPAATLQPALEKIPKNELRAGSAAFKKTVAKLTKGKSYNGMNLTNIINAVTRTLYAEAKGESREAQDAVASVIWNRAGGKCENLISVISKPSHFSCWNQYKGGWDDKTYTLYRPPETISDESKKETWNYCALLATKLAKEEFTSTIGNRNSYMNKKKASQKNINAWGGKLDLKIGNQDFGYLPDNDGFKKEARKAAKKPTYIVKPGDTLAKIAKDHNTTVDDIVKKNGIKDRNKISIGQKLVV